MARPVQLSVVMLTQGSTPGPLRELFDHIQSRAREIFLRRGPQDGHDVDDWLTAEQEFVYRPAAEMCESEGEFAITLAVPGFAAKDLQADVAADAIVIETRAAGAAEKSEENAGRMKVLFSELRGKPIYRKFDLPSGIDPNQCDGKVRMSYLSKVEMSYW